MCPPISICLKLLAACLLSLFIFGSQTLESQQPHEIPSYCPQTAKLEDNPTTKVWLKGVIGRKHVRMYLDRGGSAVVGLFYDTSEWNPILLGGHWSSDNKIIVQATSEAGAELGQMSGQFESDQLTCVYKSAKQEDKILLSSEVEPGCDSSPPNRTFKNPSWPISFSYPDDWHLVAGENITLTCPDPSAMAYGMASIEIVKGEKASPLANGVPRCQGKWEYGDSCDDCDFGPQRVCEFNPFPTSRRAGMTILNADRHEWPTPVLAPAAISARAKA